MEKKRTLALRFCVMFILLICMQTANSQDTKREQQWYHYEPEVCLKITEDGETAYPVCETQVMDGPCDIQTYCVGGILW